MGSKADRKRGIAQALAANLPDVVLATRGTHLGRAGIADVRIVGPNHNFGLWASKLQQALQRIEHVLVAKVPGLRAPVVHDPVVLFRGRHETSVGGCIKESIPVGRRVVELPLQKVAKHRHHWLLAPGITFADRDPSIESWIALPRRKAGVAFAGDRRSVRVDVMQIVQNRVA